MSLEEWFEMAPGDPDEKNCAAGAAPVRRRKNLRADRSLDDLATAMSAISWKDWVAGLAADNDNSEAAGPVWLTPKDACCVGSSRGNGAPDAYTYRLAVIVADYCNEKEDKKQEDTVKAIAIAASDAASTSVTLSQLLRWLMHSSSGVDVTLKAFATQPRQPLPRLDRYCFADSSEGAQAEGIRALRYHFVALTADDDTANTSASATPNSSSSIQEVEFRQSTVEDWSSLAIPSVPKLTISCSMPEFSKLGTTAPAKLLARVQELSLLLHFWVQGPPLQAFCENILKAATTPQLQTLLLQYLDISDDGWVQLMESLHEHPTIHTIAIQFTDNFVDNYRRLTPERRAARSRAVLDLVRANIRVRTIAWPSFQHDEAIVAEIQQVLQARRGR